MVTNHGWLNRPPLTTSIPARYFSTALETSPKATAAPSVISKNQWVLFGKRLLLLGAVLSFAGLPRAHAATDCTTVTEIPQVECEALVALYTNTDGANWSDSPGNNWNVTDTPCSWMGVTCSAGHVTRIDRDSIGLIGPIPAELGNLSQLKVLYLYSNQLSGTIPVELGNMSQLADLRLGRNQLSGPIPSELENLSQLKVLYLDSNQLSGAIPTWLGNLSLLTDLLLDRNQLSGPIPTELGNLILLDDLRLAGNQLSGSIPSELGNLSQLTRLYLYNNQLSGPIPSELGNLSRLTELYLSSNQLSGPIPSELGNLSQLTRLDLSGNGHYDQQQGKVIGGLSGTIPSELGNLSQLTGLYLNSNQLSGTIPVELGNMSQLADLRLGRNQLSGPIPSELENLSQLKVLYLDSNQLSGAIPTWLGNLSLLTDLLLDRNQLSGPIPTELGNLILLDDLRLAGNQLSGSIPSELGNLSQLTNLNLSGNQLSGPIPSELGNLSQLTRLVLSGNGHYDQQQGKVIGGLSGTIPSELGNLSQLTNLYLHRNNLSGPIPSELGNLSQLTTLWLGGNQLSAEIPPSLSNLSGLEKLDLGYNHLTASDAELINFLDIKDPGWADTQTIALIECADGGTVSVNPTRLDFGTEAVGDSTALTIDIRSQGCGDLQVDTVDFTGDNAAEFIDKDPACYDGESQGQTFSACQFTLVFSPTAAGTKYAGLSFTFNDTNIPAAVMPLQASAVDPGQPNLAVSPTTHDFGTVTLGKGPFDEQTFTVENTGNVNLKFDNMALAGVDAEDFSLYGGCSSKAFLRPSEQCQFSAQFIPTLSTGDKQANVNLAFNGLATEVPLTGTVTEAADCSAENITIASSGNGAWDSANTWDSGTPTETDVVQINNGHTITGVAFAKVKALCIEEGATLVSLNNQGTALEIQATDYIQNKGTLRGKDGTSETAVCTNQAAVGTETCAYPGASIILKVGTVIKSHAKVGDLWWHSYESGGPILNAGEIKAGNGGNGSQYAAPGGNAIVLGRNTTNTGTIQAGNGGNLTGTDTGEAGQGGLTQIWGKLGGLGHLYNQNGAQALAGKGGDCNLEATEPQTGGKGGNLWLVSLPNVHLNGGQHEAGAGGTDCVESGGTDGQDGWVRIEPNVIDLSGASTIIKGGDIAIYGGNDWTLDLSNLSGTVITATGDITLAVGEGGLINMRGSTDTILQAGGQVQIFADEILLDEDVALSDIIQATDIVVGPSKILREVSVTGAGKLSAEPEVTLPVSLTLSNNGPEADTYTLSVTDSAGWTLGLLPSTIEVKELDTVDLVLDVTLPTTRGATNVITVTATSQADSEVKATAKVQIAVAEVIYTLNISTNGSGTGTVTAYSRIDCGSSCTENYLEGSTVILTATPANGSTFAGWSGTGCGDSVTITADMSCTATFDLLPIAYTLSIAKNGSGTGTVTADSGIDCGSTCSESYSEGSNITLTASPADGSTFAGWSGTDCADSLTITTDMSCTATFDLLPAPTPTPTSYTLSIAKNGSGTGTVTADSGIDCGSTCSQNYTKGSTVTLTAKPADGSTFTGWSGTDCADSVTITTDMSCTATFDLLPTPTPTPTSYTLSIAVNGSGTGTVTADSGIDCGSTCSQNYTKGSTVTLTAKPADGSTFAGWSGTGCAESVTITTDMSCTATFDLLPAPTPTTLPLTIEIIGNGTVTSQGIDCGTDCTEDYPGNTAITLTATPDNSAEFKNWGGDCSGTSNPITMTLNQAVNCTALFERVSDSGTTDNSTVSLLPAAPNCHSTGVINMICSNYGQVIKDITIGKTASVAGGKVTGYITNKGLISQVTVLPGAVIRGGKLTGYIKNKGTLADFKFVGAAITGGILSGTIINNSRVGGLFKDVQLAANTHIIGGAVAGDIQGDCDAPARLENVTVKVGSHLSCVMMSRRNEPSKKTDFRVVLADSVTIQNLHLAANNHLKGGQLQGNIIGDLNAPARLDKVKIKAGSHLVGIILGNGVKLGEGVTFGEGVQFANPNDRPETTTDTPTELPTLGEAVAVDAEGETFNTDADFAGGISVNEDRFEPRITQSLSDIVDIRGRVSVASEHIEQLIEILVVVAYRPLDAIDSAPLYLMLNDSGNVLPWDRDMASLMPFETVEASAEPIEVPIYNGKFEGTWVLNIYFGYCTTDGTVIYSPKSLEVTITE